MSPASPHSLYSPGKTAGFTLAEMMVAVAIVAVLAALAFPSFSDARLRAQEIRCMSNLKSIQVGLMAYASDHDGTLPSNAAATGAEWWWHNLYVNGFVGAQAFACPTDQTGFSPGTSAPFTAYNGSTYLGHTLPNGKVSYGGLGNYAIWVWGRPLASFPRPAASVLLVETQNAGQQLGKSWFYNYPRTPGTPSDIAFPHRRGTAANILFMDGHVASMTRAQYQADESANRIVTSF